MDPPEIHNPVQVSKFSSFLLNSIWVFDYSIRNEFLYCFLLIESDFDMGLFRFLSLLFDIVFIVCIMHSMNYEAWSFDTVYS